MNELAGLSEECLRNVATHLGVSLTTVKRWAAGTGTPHASVVPHVISAIARVTAENHTTTACCKAPMIDATPYVTRCINCGWRSA